MFRLKEAILLVLLDPARQKHYNPLQWWELLANNTASHPRRIVSSAALLRDLQSNTACWFPSAQTVT